MRSPLGLAGTLLASVLVAACGGRSDAEPEAVGLEPVPVPAAPGSRLPRWTRAASGELWLSWVEPGSGPGAASLRFARCDGGGFRPAQTIASGEDWFVNWADFPAVAARGDQELLAHVLQRSGPETYDYHVRCVRSADGGGTWDPPVRLHTHDGPGEHGFVSLVPLRTEGFAAVWLDGRNASGHEAGTGAGATALYLRRIGAGGELGTELLLDERVCDCCPTSALEAQDGALLVAYRDRADDEVRDIAIARVEAGTARTVWTSGDRWRIAGCPVNGPVLCERGDRVAIAWYALDERGTGRVLCALSDDDGRTFSVPVPIADGEALGRVDAVFDDSGRLVILWLASGARGAAWHVARIEEGGRRIEERIAVATDPGRASGLARLVDTEGGLLLAWTDVAAEPIVRAARLAWR